MMKALKTVGRSMGWTNGIQSCWRKEYYRSRALAGPARDIPAALDVCSIPQEGS